MSCDSTMRPDSPVSIGINLHSVLRPQGRLLPNSKSYANLATLPRHTKTVTELDASQKNPLLPPKFI